MARDKSRLRDVLMASCERAWNAWTKKYPRERFYAFALYTTLDAEYFVPSICGEDGLTKVAREYLKRKSYATLEEARQGLRSSFADSPYHGQGERYSDGVEEALDATPIPYEQSERAADKVIRARLDAAIDALRTLDAKGVFGKGARRKNIVLLIEAGDRDQEWVSKLAKSINPKEVYASYVKQFEPQKVGKFTELGSKKVYETRRLALSADNRLLLAACEYDAFYFDVPRRKQLWNRVVRRGDDLAIQSGTISASGSIVALAWESLGAVKSFGVTLWRGKEWKETLEISLHAQPFDIAMEPIGNWLAVAMIDNHIRVFSASDGKPIKTIKGHKEWPRRIAASADGKWLASADERGGSVLWDTSNWSARKRLKRPADSVSFDRSATLLATTLRYPNDDDDPAGQVAIIWDVSTGRMTGELRVAGWKIKRAVLSPDGKGTACAMEHRSDSKQQKAALLDTRTGKVLTELAADFEDINDFAFLPDNRTIAVAVHGHHRKPVILWNIASGR